MSALTIDPGASTGVTLQLANRLPITFAVREPTSRLVLDLIRWAQAYADGAGDPLTLIIVEAQFVQPRKGPGGKDTINWPSLAKLARSASRWVVVADLLKIESRDVPPGEWQGPSFASVEKVDANGKVLTTKQRSKIVCERAWSEVDRGTVEQQSDGTWKILPLVRVPIAKVTKDQRDSLAMARWWWLRGSRPRASKGKLPAKKASRRKRAAA